MNKITQRPDGNYDVKISFDITDHGHTFGVPRNYNLSKVQKLIRSKDVQQTIKNGYAICMYGHGARAKEQGYIAFERNHNTGEEQEPIGKVTSLSIKDKIITYDAVIAITAGNKGQSVADMIKAGIGGFSFVWDVSKGVFYGADFVLSPNFNGNRVVMDSICTDGTCQLDTSIRDTVLDAIGEHDELYDVAKDLLEHQESAMQAIQFKGKMMAMKDSIQSLQDELEERDITIENQKIDLDAISKKYADATRKRDEMDEEAKELLLRPLQDMIDKLTPKAVKLDSLEEAIEDSGLTFKDGKIQLDSTALGNLFTPADKDKYKIDTVQLDGLRKPKRSQGSPLDAIEMKY